MIEVPKQQPSPAVRAGRVLAVFAIAFVAFVTVNSLRGGTTSVSVPSISALTAEASAALKFESPSVTMTSSSHPALGTVQAICDKSGPAPKLYVNISYAKWTALDGPESPNRAGFWLSFDLPEGCDLVANPVGAPGFSIDGRLSIYSLHAAHVSTSTPRTSQCHVVISKISVYRTAQVCCVKL